MALSPGTALRAVGLPPIVYAGPTVSATKVAQWLPSSCVMPPVRRGDLYRDRLLGYTTFLVIDGAFFDRPAVAPREIIDVIQDGAIVYGASSLGAIRAAECWPAGMRGVGSIYRLYRRGCLTSDDEVVVTFAAQRPHWATTVPLINVRYAAGRALRTGLLNEQDARRLVQAAGEMYFADREWSSILRGADLSARERELLPFLRAQDLKALDAVRSLRQLRAVWHASRTVPMRRVSVLNSGLLSKIESREFRGPRPPASPATRQRLWRWLAASGQYRRCTPETTSLAANQPSSVALLRALLVRKLSRSSPLRAALAAAVESETWHWHLRASQEAIARARSGRLQPGSAGTSIARQEVSHHHGFGTWTEMRTALAANATVWRAVRRAARDLALANCVRSDLFREAGPSHSSVGPGERT